MIDCTKIKLVIWDLDETFWKGTLSDNNVEIVEENIKLIKDMTDAGVVCSICSKNEETQVEKIMKDLGIWDLFVFKSINWTPKGNRVKQIIEEMNLRQPNVLFIDDNNSNLGEVKAVCPNSMCENVEVIEDLIKYFSIAEKKDPKHARLEQYKVLERKKEFRATMGSNIEFLIKSDIKLDIKYDCIKKIDRIHDLILRSNQLNFTKIRSSKEELIQLIEDDTIQKAYVEVKDSFGDYGIVGFYALKNNSLIHFVFSCRTLNMGVEQYVYAKLGKPDVEIQGEVSSNLESDFPYWINQENNKENKDSKEKIENKNKILIKGPCDMSQMFSYIQETKNIITEFVYVNDKGVSIEQGNHTLHVVQSKTLSKEEKEQIINDLPFGDKDMYSTSMFDKDMSVIVYSLFTDPNLGVYKNKTNNIAVAFGEYTNDLTDENIWQELIQGKRFVANCKFTHKDLEKIKQNYDFCGRLTPEQIIENLEYIYKNIAQDAILILVLGSEVPYENNNQPAYEDRHVYNKNLNRKLRDWVKDKNRIRFININELIDGQHNFTNNINHFTKDVYFKMSQTLINLLKTSNDINIKQITKFGTITRNIKTFIKKCLNKIRKIFTSKK